MKKTEASWNCDLSVECPYCDEYQHIDYSIIDEYWHIFKVCESQENVDYIHTCEECGKEFIVDSTCW